MGAPTSIPSPTCRRCWASRTRRSRAVAPRLGLDVSYPLIRRLSDGADIIIEPLAQLSISTDPDLDPRIPIEDTQTLELDEIVPVPDRPLPRLRPATRAAFA